MELIENMDSAKIAEIIQVAKELGITETYLLIALAYQMGKAEKDSE